VIAERHRLYRWLLGLAAGLVVGTSYPATAADQEAARLSPEQMDQLRRFADAVTAIREGYVAPVDFKWLIDVSLRGIVAELDPESSYLDANAVKELTSSRDLGGIGLELGTANGVLKVVAPIERTPSQQAGLRAGDLILRIDERSTQGMSVAEAVKLLRGKPNTQVALTVERAGEKKPKLFTITRQLIQVDSVTSRFVEPGYAYLRLRQFQDDTGPSLVKHLRNLYLQEPLSGVVLDLRNNSGGLLFGGLGVAAVFLPPSSLVMTTKGRAKGTTRAYLAIPEDVSRTGKDYLSDIPSDAKTVPMVVLVNHASAAASEIVAAALQDHQRATIVGVPTYGRASIQTILPLSDQTAIKLTTAHWLSPNGRSLQPDGLVPDIVVSKEESEASPTGTQDDALLGRALALLKDRQRPH
jgi:carboxyl-terminal processing protease